MLRQTIISVAVTLAGTAYAADHCLGALVTDRAFNASDTVTALALTSLVNQENFSEQQRNLAGEVTLGGVKLNAAGADAQRAYAALQAQTHLNWNAATSATLLTSTLSQAAVAAYKICQQGQLASGPHVQISDASSSQATVTVTWIAPPHAPTSASGSVTIAGGHALSPMPWRLVTGQSTSRTINRVPGQDLRVIADFGGLSDAESLPYVPQLSSVRITETAVFPPAGPAIKLDNDGTGRNQGPVQGCFQPTSGSVVRAGSAKVLSEARGGAIDSTSYVRVVVEEPERVCYEAFLRPLAKEGGGLMTFRVSFLTDRWIFAAR